MHPQTSQPKFRALALLVAGVLSAPAFVTAQQQQQDTPNVDIGQLLQALRGIRTIQATQMKGQKLAAFQQVSAAAGSNERATAFWEEAVRATQMEGAGKENAQFRAWKDTEGESFKEPAVQNAVRLHLEWVALSLQRSSGVLVKDMLPSVVKYTQELIADEMGMDALQEAIKREKEQAANNPKKAQRSRDDAGVKKVHDSILHRNVSAGVIAQWLKLTDFLTIDHWELNAGNIDGIYRNVILPELRSQRDQRVFEYWDMKLKKEAEVATKTKLAFEIDKFNTQRRPTLLWNRAQEFVALGMKNRGYTEMFNIIKTYPTHPDADDWVAKLENLLMPPVPETLPGTPTAPGGTAPSSTVAPVPTAPPTAAAPVAPVPGL